jgi:uncharacterized protein YqfA (UPF0365 family)
VGDWITFIAVFGLIILAAVFAYFFPVVHWYIASQEGIRISVFQLAKLRMQGYPLDELLDNLIKAKRSRLNISLDEIKAHYENGGNINNVVNGLIMAKEHDIPLDKRQAFMADLKKIDLVSGIDQLRSKSP